MEADKKKPVHKVLLGKIKVHFHTGDPAYEPIMVKNVEMLELHCDTLVSIKMTDKQNIETIAELWNILKLPHEISKDVLENTIKSLMIKQLARFDADFLNAVLQYGERALELIDPEDLSVQGRLF